MSQSVMAERYAEALFQRGQEIGTIDQLYDELQTVREVFENNEQLSMFLKHPRIHRQVKYEVLDRSFQSMHRDVVNILKLLVDHKRTEGISSLTEHFMHLVHEAKEMVVARVYSVYELTETDRQIISEKFAVRLQKKKVIMENIVDPSLIGGLKVQIGNTVYDGSIQRKLEKLKDNIAVANE